MDSGSFTSRVVAELAPQTPQLDCCRRAFVEGMELASLEDGYLTTARLVAARAAIAALHPGRPGHVERRARPRHTLYRVTVGPVQGGWPRCLRCPRSMLAGAFIASGSASRPDRPPHIELSAVAREKAAVLAETCQTLSLQPGVTRRRGRWLVLIRAAGSVGDFLSSIGAQASRLEFEEGRVVGEMRASVNRRLNGETANLRRTAAAGVRQVDAVRALDADGAMWGLLPPAVREAAELRRRFPVETLQRLAFEAGCSRSAMADRLRRLVDAASRGQEGGGNVVGTVRAGVLRSRV